jgi:hypothetical protein
VAKQWSQTDLRLLYVNLISISTFSYAIKGRITLIETASTGGASMSSHIVKSKMGMVLVLATAVFAVTSAEIWAQELGNSARWFLKRLRINAGFFAPM